MAFNRVLYLTLLAGSVAFYFASGVWVSWLLVLLLLLLPPLSLLVCLPAMLHCRLEVFLPRTVELGEDAALRLHLSANRFLPLPEVQVRLNLRTRDREKDIRYLSRLTRTSGVLAVPTDFCGFLAPEFHRGRVYDALGLFWLPLRTPKPEPLAILPPALIPTPLPRLELALQTRSRPKPGGGSAELHDHRAYRPGDPVRDIHWKLSLKTDSLIVREPLDPVRQRIVLALRTPRGTQARAVGLGNLRWLSGWLLDKGIDHELVWMQGRELRGREVRTPEELLEALRSACLAPEDSDPLPLPLPIKADWVCPVGPEGGRA